jgi:hypothetical protein
MREMRGEIRDDVEEEGEGEAMRKDAVGMRLVVVRLQDWCAHELQPKAKERGRLKQPRETLLSMSDDGFKMSGQARQTERWKELIGEMERTYWRDGKNLLESWKHFTRQGKTLLLRLDISSIRTPSKKTNTYKTPSKSFKVLTVLRTFPPTLHDSQMSFIPTPLKAQHATPSPSSIP